jgi:hypothetical protein
MKCVAPVGHQCDADARAVRTGIGEVAMCGYARKGWKDRTWPFTGWTTEQRRAWAAARVAENLKRLAV